MRKEARILSLWQPWASLVALGLKKYETRSWGTNYRGRIAIQATAKQPICVSAELERIWRTSGFSLDFKRAFAVDDRGFRLPLPQGCIVAIADLTDCLQMTTRFRGDAMWQKLAYPEPLLPISEQASLEVAVGDWQPGRYAWKLENVHALAEPVPCRGAQGLRVIQDENILRVIQLASEEK